MSATGSRSVRKTVAALPRRLSWAICPSTHTSPSRPIQSATLRATVRTGQGASGDDGAVTPPASQDVPTTSLRCRLAGGLSGVGLGAVESVAQHPQVRLACPGRLLVVQQFAHRALGVAAQPAAQLGDAP